MKIQWSKLLPILVILAGFIMAQECIFLMYLCIKFGYTAAAAWLTAAIGVAEAIIGASLTAYISLCKVDHKEGGITFEAAKAKNFVQESENSPKI
jgi:hypothetical protein